MRHLCVPLPRVALGKLAERDQELPALLRWDAPQALLRTYLIQWAMVMPAKHALAAWLSQGWGRNRVQATHRAPCQLPARTRVGGDSARHGVLCKVLRTYPWRGLLKMTMGPLPTKPSRQVGAVPCTFLPWPPAVCCCTALRTALRCTWAHTRSLTAPSPSASPSLSLSSSSSGHPARFPTPNAVAWR